MNIIDYEDILESQYLTQAYIKRKCRDCKKDLKRSRYYRCHDCYNIRLEQELDQPWTLNLDIRLDTTVEHFINDKIYC